MKMFARMAAHRAVSRGAASITVRLALFRRRRARRDCNTQGGRLCGNKNTWPVSSLVYCRNFPSSYAAVRLGRSCVAFIRCRCIYRMLDSRSIADNNTRAPTGHSRGECNSYARSGSVKRYFKSRFDVPVTFVQTVSRNWGNNWQGDVSLSL